ncbi:MAG: hypothetical protein GY844_21335 [Bradyrhizobium sp.]|nr:hypothetical protein [Bradyrhizobium sp.]
MSEPFDVDAAAEALGEAEASLAVVAIGTADGDSGAAILRSLASAVDGRFEQLGGEADLSQLAGIFGQFVSSARGGAVRRVEPRTMDLTALALAEGIVMPPLNAYILSAANGQDVEVFGRVAGDAVLALRRAGLGRSAGLAVHLRGKDNEAWQLSPKTSRLIVALAQWALRPGEDGRFTGQASRSGGQVAVRIEASDDGTPINDLQLSASVVGEAGEAVSHPLEQTAPGRYELHLPADGHARWLAVSDADGAAVWRQSLAGGYAEEFSKLGADGQRLSELAALAGGQMVYRLDQATVLDEPHLARGELSLWPALLGASLALMLIEWASVRARRRSA